MADSQSGKIKFKLSGTVRVFVFFFRPQEVGMKKTHLFQVRFEHNCKSMIRKVL